MSRTTYEGADAAVAGDGPAAEALAADPFFPALPLPDDDDDEEEEEDGASGMRTSAGERRSTLSPVPSCPWLFRPQASTRPPAVRRRVWRAPAATRTKR
jgi:hypothetical protein